jgi:hypothetical protein
MHHQATFYTYNLYVSLIVIVAIRAVELEYACKILYWGRSQSWYIFTDSDSTALIVTRQWVGRLKNRSLIHGGGKRCNCCQENPDWMLGPAHLHLQLVRVTLFLGLG